MFSFLTKPHLPSNSIGLEKDFVTAVSIEGSRQNFRINRAATVDLPAGLINPSFTDKNISSQANLRVYIEEAIGAAGLLDKKRWSVSLPASSCRSSILTVENDPSLKRKLEEVLDWKAEQSFGVPARQMRISWYSLGTDTQGKARYFASAIRLEVLEEYEALFEGMGLNAGLIITKPVAEASWLADKLGDRLLISEQSDGFTGILMRAGTPSFIRNVNCSAEQIYDEIYRLLLFYSDRFSEGNSELLSSILLIDSSLKAENVKSVCREALGREVEIISNYHIGLEMPPGMPFNRLAAPSALAAQALA